MSFEKAKAYLTEKGYEARIRIFDVSTATVELAAAAVGTEPRRIAKSLTFKLDGKPIMVVCAGDAKINNAKFKAFFHQKAVMLAHDEVGEMIGHEVGGACPFGVSADVSVFLDESLLRFDEIYPACGSDNSAVRLTPQELEVLSGSRQWIDVCKLPEEV